MAVSRKKSLIYNKKEITSFSVWEFWDYVSPGDNNMIEAWLKSDVSLDCQLTFEKMLKSIWKVENHLNWTFLRRKPFIRKAGMVWELGFKADGRQYRVLGTFRGKNGAVFLLGCYHKQQIYFPPNAIDEAFKRKRLLENGEAKHFRREVPAD